MNILHEQLDLDKRKIIGKIDKAVNLSRSGESIE
jgi:hypothetical protein